MKNRRNGSRLGVDSLVNRVLGEYHEMAGLKLTTAQASRLWALDASSCEELLHLLAERRLLRRTPDGSFVRA